MRIPGEYHAHTEYCDGKATCTDMIAAAVARGYSYIGLSSHSFVDDGKDMGISGEKASRYRGEMMVLADIYGDRIKVLTGIEQDIRSAPATGLGYDYIIGSVHYVGDTWESTVTVDHSPEVSDEGVRRVYGGDWMRFVADYYETAARIPTVTGCDFVGHFDLITKFNEGNRFFDEDSPRYRSIAYEALKYAAADCPVFEMNSGGVRRGARSTTYPSDFLLRSMRELGCMIMFSSDAHDPSSLGFMFGEMAERARAAGFTSAVCLTENGFMEYGIN